MIFFFLTSGLFLGWSLGGNNGANIFGTAVGTKMLKFRTAASICAVFIIIGPVISGSGTSATIGHLGPINAIAGAFIVALAAAIAVFGMSKYKLPVSASQAIVGSIIGWNIYSGLPINWRPLTMIIMAWIASPILSAIGAIIIFSLIRLVVNHSRIHLFRLDLYTRIGLVVVCAIGAYSFGANNIANVIGVFVMANPFRDFQVLGITISALQQMFFIGGLAMAVGIITYSRNVSETVGGNIFKLSPESGLAAVLSSTIVIFLFTSVKLQNFLISCHLPSLPLVPLSSSQAIVGSIIGIGILKGARGIRYRVLSEIAIGWLVTPIIAGVLSFIALFILQNVFNQNVTGF